MKKSRVVMNVEKGNIETAKIGALFSQFKIKANLGKVISDIKSAIEQKGLISFNVPIHFTFLEDKTFTFEVRSPVTSSLIKMKSKIEKGASNAKNPVAKITKGDILAIAELKKEDMNTSDLEKAISIVKATAKSMGIEEVDG